MLRHSQELGSVRALSQRALLLAFAGSFSASFVLKSVNMDGSNQLTIFRRFGKVSGSSMGGF